MRLIFTVFIVALLTQQALPQCNDLYYHRIYSTWVERDIPYGTALAYNGSTVNLQMNIWKPVGDSNTSRPIILWIHGGGFYGGNKNDMDAMAQWYAERGYVAATMSYRLGFYGNLLFGPPYTYDRSEIIRAIYRAVQDANGAMRFLKGRAAQDSSNVSMAFIGGESAGSITALQYTYLDKPYELPAEADSISDVVTLSGNVHRPALGPYQGVLNQNGQNSNVLAVVNIYGALKDTAFIESNTDPALFSYHQVYDGIVSCGYNVPYWSLPLNVSQYYPALYGSCRIEQRVQNLGFSPLHYQSLIYNGNMHDIHDDALVDSLIARFLSDIICENITAVNDVSTEPNVKVFPNPAKDVLNIRMLNSDFQFALFDMNGRKIIAPDKSNNHVAEINTSSLSKGMYVLNLITESHTITKKIIIN
ncbi:MAG: Esterase/lipase-like protein [Bacteroidetes bacterium OLB10]|nr:MAG: Esterase/lipase-like protein [Bacteroidetes bacterium OLB10]